MGLDILTLLATVAIGIFTFFKWSFKHWERLNVPYIKPTFPFGTISNPFCPAETFGVTLKRQYGESKRNGHKHVGLFTFNVPMYMPIDLDIVKSVLRKDFRYFTDRGIYFDETNDPLSAHLFAMEGEKWKKLRAKLTSAFSSGKMKMMFEKQVECGRQLVEAVECSMNEAIDIKQYISCFTVDIIGNCVFGVNCNSFKDPSNDFLKCGKWFSVHTNFNNVKTFLALSNHPLISFLRVLIMSQDITKLFMGLVESTVAYRRKHSEVRKDFIQILIDLKDDADGNDLSIEEIAAQTFLFFFAGYETSTSTITFTLYELSENQEVQEKVRREINSVLDSHGGVITYEAIKEMKYLNEVVEEVLRKYPPLPMLNRRCLSDYKVPNSDLTIKKGTLLSIPLLGLHYDAEYFPNPERFDPERFNEENKKKIVPFTYMPFGEGPRICIGMRFGLMEALTALSLLLQNFRFSLSSKTKTPLQMNPLSMLLTVVGDIWLNVEKL